METLPYMRKIKCKGCDYWREDIYYTLQDGPLCTDCLRGKCPEFFKKEIQEEEVKNMESLGEFLKNGRKAKGIALEDITQRSGVRIHYLRWLEGNELDRMPPTVYAKGYLRAYCDSVGLDRAEAFLRYSRQVSPPEPEEEDKEGEPFFTKQKILTGTLVASVFIAVLMVI